MTDLERLRELLDSWEVPYREDDWEPTRPPKESVYAKHPWHPKLHQLTVGPPDSGIFTVDGYTMFFTTFDFTPEGQFVKMGAWE